VSLKARISIYNIKPDGSRDYLSVGETELDTLYWVGWFGCAWGRGTVVDRPMDGWMDGSDGGGDGAVCVCWAGACAPAPLSN